MGSSEPLLRRGRAAAGPFLVGRNSRGNWVVTDPAGRHGGLFVDRGHALKYALSENGNRAVTEVEHVLELDLNLAPALPAQRRP